jgi:hypothetical protein
MVEFNDLKEELQKDRPIPFSTQFLKCEKEGLTKETKFFSFEEYPQFLPMLPSPKMAKLIKSGKWKGNDLIVCGRFGAICNGGHNECRKMRGLSPSSNEQLK